MTSTVTDSSAAVPPLTLHHAPLRDLDPAPLYGIMRLRQDVFFLEHRITEEDLDSRELEDSTLLLWAQADDEVLGTLRILADADGGMRIGRVAVRADQRRTGLGGRLMREAIALAGADRTVRLDAQAYLEGWYRRMGFATTGPRFEEAGIAHVPMALAPRSQSGSRI